MMRRTTSELAALLGAELSGAGTAQVAGVAIDSRAVQPGMLFVALPGARVDGHDFVVEARDRGAGAALVSRRVNVELPQILVADTLRALGALAQAERTNGSGKLAAITGSIAKTTTKEFLVALLATTYRVGFTHGNRNSESGFPVELCNLPEGVAWMVAELGMSHAGELDRLGAIATPDVLLYTVVAPVHLEFFTGLDTIAEAKAELIPHLRPNGTLVLNAADARVRTFEHRFGGQIVRYGVQHESDLWLEEYWSRGLLGASFRVRGAGVDIAVELPLPGRHQADNLLAASAAALALGVSPSAVSAAAASLRPAPRRGEVHQLANGITIVDDCYNASPEAMTRVLELLADTSGRRIAVLGEMLELGPTSPALHRAVGERAAAVADIVLAVGGAPAKELALAAGPKARHLADAESALAAARELVRAGDVVLVKGSRGIALERVVDGLLAEVRR
jgi:UDP-N-acetylmuramoyl-tripeptide--D-alanyl-D-alanine ligase